jgi:hypothetical protein
MNLRGTHHGYYGLAMMAAGTGLWALTATWWLRLLAAAWCLIGLWVLGDDVYQHVRQLWQPDYESSLHRWYVRVLWGNPLVQRLNRWLDRLLGA